MAIDTPAKLAILGAGPIGLEAALYARFLGYDVVVFDEGEVAQSVCRWGHVRMFTPFAASHSPLGVAAIQAQDESYQPPADDEHLTGREWVDRYLLPLARTDLLSDHLRLHTKVLRVGKEELLPGDMPGHEDRGDWPFRILVRNPAGEEQIETADAVLDCTGVFSQPNALGHGGIPAVGELALAGQIEYRLPDIAGRERWHYVGKHVLLIGAGTSAATSAVALTQLARECPGTRITWVTRREGPAGAGGPIATLQSDPLPERAALVSQANRLTADPNWQLTYWPATVVENISRNAAGLFEVNLSGRHAGPIVCDEIIANVGYHPNRSLYEELQVDQPSAAAMPLRHSEPNFYILGAKSRGRRSDFLFADGLVQIRAVFAILGDRSTLDLYASAHKLVR